MLHGARACRLEPILPLGAARPFGVTVPSRGALAGTPTRSPLPERILPAHQTLEVPVPVHAHPGAAWVDDATEGTQQQIVAQIVKEAKDDHTLTKERQESQAGRSAARKAYAKIARAGFTLELDSLSIAETAGDGPPSGPPSREAVRPRMRMSGRSISPVRTILERRAWRTGPRRTGRSCRSE